MSTQTDSELRAVLEATFEGAYQAGLSGQAKGLLKLNIERIMQLIEADRRKSVEEAKVRAFDDGWEACEKREPVSIQAAIKFRQDQNNWTDSQMAAMLDLEKSHFSEFKHGKRGLPVNSIRKAYAIGIPASVLLADQLSRPSTNEGGGK